MGFLKKMFGDTIDDLKKSIEDSKNEMLNRLNGIKNDAHSSFASKSSMSKIVDGDDDDGPRIIIGKLEDGVLIISESISEFDDESLEDYKQLRKIVFPASLKKLDSEVICDQEKLETADFSKVTLLKEIPDEFISGKTRIKEFVIPQGVIKVGDGFLGESGAGTKVFIPASVKELGYINGNYNNDQYVYLFAPNIDISDIEQDIKTLYVLPEFYGYYAKQLKDCESEARLREMPNDMMSIYTPPFAAALTEKPIEKTEEKNAGGNAHFGGPTPEEMKMVLYKKRNEDKEKTYLEIPGGVTEIDRFACFHFNMEEIKLPSTLKKIRREAFVGCDMLENVVIPENVEYIEDGAFSHSRNLRNVTILSKKLKKIGTMAFWGCPEKNTISFPNGMENIIIGGLNTFEKVFLPASMKKIQGLDGKIIYCFSPQLEELKELCGTSLYVLPEYMDNYKSQVKAEGIPDNIKIRSMPDKYLDFYDNK